MLSLKDLTYLVRISRPGNLLIMFLSFILGAYLVNHGAWVFLGHTVFWAVGIAIVLVGAGGYWVNDVNDFKIDRINKPAKAIVNTFLSIKKVMTCYLVMHVLLIPVCFFTTTPKLASLIFLSAFLLYVYAVWLKRTSLMGNILVAALAALVLMMAGFLYHFNAPLVWTAIFAFEVSLIREIVKDVEDIQGDFAFQLKTLPIQIGIQRTRIVLYAVIGLFFISCNLPWILEILAHRTFPAQYVYLSVPLVQLPTVYLLYLLSNSQTHAQFARLSMLLKFIMLGGMLSVLGL